jgi:hypothetical protein
VAKKNFESASYSFSHVADVAGLLDDPVKEYHIDGREIFLNGKQLGSQCDLKTVGVILDLVEFVHQAFDQLGFGAAKARLI